MRAYVFLIYTHALYGRISLTARFLPYTVHFTPYTLKIIPTDYQAVTKKVHFFLHFFSKIFGHIKKKLYLCTRF